MESAASKYYERRFSGEVVSITRNAERVITFDPADCGNLVLQMFCKRNPIIGEIGDEKIAVA